ncbi:MAG: hypothetical protein JNK65_02290 [Deltaproteobacteria bacterium]|nr:hypothetical protein [Deltaproteobacteria bacterium]
MNEIWKKPYQVYPPKNEWDSQKEWILEIGPGNGKFIVWMAENFKNKTMIAVELRNMRFQHVVELAKEKNLSNLHAVHGDARYCLEELFTENSLSEIFILFPDPWPKRRHNKHRLLCETRTDLFYSLLKKGGKVWSATDHPEYARQIAEVFPHEKWIHEEGKSHFPTYFETKWKKMGLPIHYFGFVSRK